MADEKTRILSAAEAARLFTRKPKVVGDKVVFYCDNGHRIVAPVRDGGKRGNCSKCGATVTVPVAEADAGAEGATMILAAPKESRITAPEEIVRPGASGRELPSIGPPRDGGEVTDDHVPSSIQGPAPEVPEVEQDAPVSAGGQAVAAEAAAPDPADWQFMQPTVSAADAEELLDSPPGHEGWYAQPDPADGDGEGGDNPTAQLVARLWVEHEIGGTLELHLQDGSVIFPQSYERRWSRGTHGLFAAAAPDGSITLTAVAWDAVQKIIVRNVKGLPDGMFE